MRDCEQGLFKKDVPDLIKCQKKDNFFFPEPKDITDAFAFILQT